MIPDRDEAGEVRGILIVLLDIEEDWRLRRALDDQRKRLQLVVDNIGVPMSYVDRDLRLPFANRVGIDWRVPAVEDAIGKHVSEVFAPRRWRASRPSCRRRCAARSASTSAAPSHDGERRWIRAHLVPDTGPDGLVRGVYTLVIDVDHDHRLREALERQEAQLRYLAENIPGPIAVVDRDFRYVFANKVFQRQRGMKLEDIVGRHVRDVLGPDLAAKYFDPFLERLNRGEPCSFEREVGPAGGEQRWHLVNLAPIMDARGAFNGCYIVASDIHDIKMGEERLRAQQAQLRLFTDNIPDAVAYLDRDRRILFANRKFAMLRGVGAEELIGKSSVEAMGPEIAAWIAQRTQKVLDRGEVATYERLTRCPTAASAGST